MATDTTTAQQPYPPTSSLPPPAPPPRRSLPLGVAVLSVLIGLYAIVLVVLGALVLAGVAVGVLGQYFGSVTSFAGLTGAVLGGILLVVGLIILGIAVALWRLRMWALVLAILVLFFEIVVYAIAGQFYTVGFVLSVVILLYLIAVHRHFR